MADIRINSLPSTATSFNTDDYIAIDGASAGTRRMLAANPPFSDVTLGASGPSVKSSLSARAPRQGLVFDGTAGATATLGSAIGSGNTTYHVNFLCPSSAGIAGIIAVGDFSIQDSLVIQLDGSDRLALVLYVSGGQYSSYYIPSFTATYGGKRVTVSFTRNGTTINGFVNGISVSLTANNSGTPPAWNTSITTTSVLLGKLQSAAYYLNGVIYNALIYNRALSASEVVALYEAGAPATATYGGGVNDAGQTVTAASSTSLVTGANSNFSSDSGYWNKLNTVTISGGNCTLGSGAGIYRYSSSLVQRGKYYGFTVTISALSGTLNVGSNNGTTYLGVSSQVSTTSTGTFSGYFYSDLGNFIISVSGGGSATLTGFTIFPAGLLLAPDAAQAGGGLTWYDTSGNAANITLPASGVSWNVPFGNNIAASGTNQNLTLNASGTGSILLGSNGVARGQIAGVNKNGSTGPASSGTTTNGIWRVSNVSNSLVLDVGLQGNASPYPGYIQVSDYSNLATSYPLSLNPNGGNVLIGTTTDNGKKLQVKGGTQITDSASASNFITIGSGNDAPYGGNSVVAQTGTLVVGTVASAGLYLFTNGVTALTLDSSKNATFEALVKTKVAFEAYDGATADRWQLYTYTDKTFRWNYNGSGSDELSMDTSGNLIVAGSMRTGTPTGGTASAWKFGKYNTTAPSATGYVEVDIGGTLYKLLAST